MRDHQTTKTGKFVTHTMMPNGGVISGGKFAISGTEEEVSFFQLYSSEINNSRPVALIERHLEFGGPIVYDLDFRFNDEALDDEINEDDMYLHIYNAEFVRTFIHQSYNIISNYIDVDKLPAAREVYVTEKKKAKKLETGVWKDGLHFIYPNIIVSPDVQYMIREELVEALRDDFDAMGVTNSAEDIIDECVIDKNGWMMYGSYKNGGEPYLIQPDETCVSGLYYADISETNIRMASGPEFARPGGTEYANNKLIRKLSIRCATLTDIAELTSTGQSHFTKWLESQTVKIRNKIEETTGCKSVKLVNSRESLKFVSGLVDLLDKKRASSRDSWIKVGWCLYNIDYRLLEKWIEFSKQDPDYADGAEEACTLAWESMEKKNMTIASLISWAKEDNPHDTNYYLTRESLTGKIRIVLGSFVSGFRKEEIKTGGRSSSTSSQIQVFQYKPIFREFVECLYPMSQLLQHCYGDEFIWSGGSWFQFINHGWKQLTTKCNYPEILKTKLVEDDGIYGIFADEAARLEQLVKKMKNDSPTDTEKLYKVDGYLKGCTEIKRKMRTPKYQDIVMSHATRMFHWENKYNAKHSGFKSVDVDFETSRQKKGHNMEYEIPSVKESIFGESDDKCPRHFEDVLDKKANLLRFANGVFDLKANLFRHGQPEDFLSMSTHIDYFDNYTWEHPDVKSTMKFLGEIQPNEENRNYILQVLASFLDGHNGQETFHVFYGRGSNGKSKLIEFFMDAMGDYATTLPVTLLTGKRTQSSGATPELAKMKGKRFSVMNEPGTGEQMNMGLMKEITGGDKIYARALNSPPIEFRFEAGIVLLCNDKPKVDPMDEATWRRIRALYFPSKFMDSPDLTVRDDQGNQLQYKRDRNLNGQLKRLRCALMWILVRYYRANQEGDPFFKWSSTYDREENGDRVLKIGLGPGIREPDAVTAFTRAYRSENDPIQHFIERVIRERAGGFVELAALYDLYKYSCYSKNIQKVPQQKFQEYFEITKNWGPLVSHNSRQGWRNREIPFNLPDVAPEFKSFLERPENINFLSPSPL